MIIQEQVFSEKMKGVFELLQEEGFILNGYAENGADFNIQKENINIEVRDELKNDPRQKLPLTKEEAIKLLSKEEVWSICEEFLTRWKLKFEKEYSETPIKYLYDYLPTDKESYELAVEIKKNYK